MQVSSTRITLERREATGNISIILTVPFGCSFLQNGNLYNCSLHIEMNVPRESTKCQPEIVLVKSLTDQDNNCGYNILRNDWQTTLTIPIAFADIPRYESPDGALRVGLKTGEMTESPGWSWIELQDVFVHVCILPTKTKISSTVYVT